MTLTANANDQIDPAPNHHSSRQALLEETRRITRPGAKGPPSRNSRKRQPRHPRQSIRVLATTLIRPSNRKERRPLCSPTHYKHNTRSPHATSRQPPSSSLNSRFSLPQTSLSFPRPRTRFCFTSSCHRRSERTCPREPHCSCSRLSGSGRRQLIKRSSRCRKPPRHRLRRCRTRFNAKRARNGRIWPRRLGRYATACC
jgi:hypothetical protein